MRKLFCLLLIAGTLGVFTSCEDEIVRDTAKFVGDYAGEEECVFDNTVNLNIAESNTVDNRIIIHNETDDYKVNATVVDSAYTISSQAITLNGGPVNISGNGVLIGAKLDGNVTFSFNGGINEVCTWDFEKR